jgi:hypothetical protein
MNKYIGVKLVEAEPDNFIDDMGKKTEGYKVIYADGYSSWSPKKVFDNAYLEITPNPKLKTGVSISMGMVNDFIKETHISTIGEKTTLVRVVLVNGFEIIESSACVDKDNYSEEMGTEICLEKIKDRIWFLLGFLLQTAVGGIK